MYGMGSGSLKESRARTVLAYRLINISRTWLFNQRVPRWRALVCRDGAAGGWGQRDGGGDYQRDDGPPKRVLAHGYVAERAYQRQYEQAAIEATTYQADGQIRT